MRTLSLRNRVLGFLFNAVEPMSLDEIHRGVSRWRPGIPVVLSRELSALVEEGLVWRYNDLSPEELDAALKSLANTGEALPEGSVPPHLYSMTDPGRRLFGSWLLKRVGIIVAEVEPYDYLTDPERESIEVDYDCLERHHKMSTWTEDQAEHFRVGWDAAEEAHYTKRHNEVQKRRAEAKARMAKAP